MDSIAAQEHRHTSVTVRKRILCGSAVVSAAIAAVVAAAGPAHAASSPTVVGKKYSDARGVLGTAGYHIVVSTTVGDQTARDDCTVTHQQDRTVPPPENTSASATKQTLLTLNCDAPVATATKPGNSLASPAGAAAAAEAKKSAAAPKPKAS